MERLLLVTHPRADGKYDSGVLEPKIDDISEFPGHTYAVTSDSETQLYAEQAYDRVLDDIRGDGLITEEQAQEMLEFDQIYRAGAQYSNCCANTDISVAAQAEETVDFTYFVDKTADVTGETVEVLEDMDQVPEYCYGFEKDSLNRNFTTFNDLIQRTF
ncbi:hypothetical protein [Candidatus Nanohalovita haloferacivicina]|uniref:hypothetical protein n=1 Tax=Candidatus Nanohalovita haloferacivicina TaxID=2978046 RepID=UPI00325FAC04|nr:hypothetical protein HBNXNv_1148 [Candidatus Nanohalobia archaeon BNXNv]